MPAIDFLDVAREPLAHLPTPLMKIGSCWSRDNLWIKHDDLTGTALNGSKVRKLEYLLADARAQGADTLVTWGGVQSNCARTLAVAAASMGLHCSLVLAGDGADEDDGNLLVSRMAGAEIHIVPELSSPQKPGSPQSDAAETALAAEEDVHITAVVDDVLRGLRRQGRRPYLIPFGGSSPVGVLGYVRAGLELAEQMRLAHAPVSTLVLPVASGGTYAGMFIGLRLAGLPVDVVGAYVLGNRSDWTRRLVELIDETCARFGLAVTAEPEDISLIDGRGAGYGRPTAEEAEFMVGFTRRTGILLDPVYSGKALWACDRAIRGGELRVERELLFLHTGGTFGLFPHRRAFRDACDAAARRGKTAARIA